MSVPVNIHGVAAEIVGDGEALRGLVEAPGTHVAFVGAGVSKDAGVLLANEISEELRRNFLAAMGLTGDEADEWANENLYWEDDKRRYLRCVERIGSAAERVGYFRQLLRGKDPSFSHHALALLMTEGKLFSTALTTNFDKLLERAFTEQGRRECQAIRTAEEGSFWGHEADKCYVLKLHGDYDTYNILNTRSDTRSLPSHFNEPVLRMLQNRGLFVLGSAGNEESIYSLIKTLAGSDNSQVLSRGIRWGVYVGDSKPSRLRDDASIEAVRNALKNGAVSRQMIELAADVNMEHGDRRPFRFFPVWGAGNVLLDLILRYCELPLIRRASTYLDHNIRLRSLLKNQGYTDGAIARHMDRLAVAQRAFSAPSQLPQSTLKAVRTTSLTDATTVSVYYGDITSRPMMEDPQFDGKRQAIVSSDDTTLSAGGGVAYRLLVAAGPRFLLNELAKHTPIEQGTAVVTSAGDLPVHYLLHAAALKISREDGAYSVSRESVRAVMGDALKKAARLGVDVLWIPLLGAGTGTLDPSESLVAIFEGAKDVASPKARWLNVVIYAEGELRRGAVHDILTQQFPEDYTVELI